MSWDPCSRPWLKRWCLENVLGLCMGGAPACRIPACVMHLRRKEGDWKGNRDSVSLKWPLKGVDGPTEELGSAPDELAMFLSDATCPSTQRWPDVPISQAPSEQREGRMILRRARHAQLLQNMLSTLQISCTEHPRGDRQTDPAAKPRGKACLRLQRHRGDTITGDCRLLPRWQHRRRTWEEINHYKAGSAITWSAHNQATHRRWMVKAEGEEAKERKFLDTDPWLVQERTQGWSWDLGWPSPPAMLGSSPATSLLPKTITPALWTNCEHGAITDCQPMSVWSGWELRLHWHLAFFSFLTVWLISD